MFFGRFGVWELLLILAVVILLFGAKRIPEVGRGLGEAMGSFRRGLRRTEENDVLQKPDSAALRSPDSTKSRPPARRE